MAEASDLFLLPFEEFAADEIEEQEGRLETLDSPLAWASATALGGAARCALGVDLFAPDPSDPGYSDQDSDSSDDHATLAFDLFDRSSTPPIGATTVPFPEPLQSPDLRVYEGPEEVRSDYLGLGLGFEGHEDGEGAEREVVVSDWGADDFFTGRRSSPSESVDFSGAGPLDSPGLRISGFDSDSDSDEQIVDRGESQDRFNDDLGLPLCWDCLQLEEQRRDLNIELEWEEVDDRLEDREDVLSIMIVGNDEISNGVRERNHDEAEREEDVIRNIDWEVLLAVNNLGRNHLDPEDVESFFVDDHEGFVYTSDYEAYEVLFGQFADHDSSLKGSPPAAKSVVENLPSVMMTKEDVDENNVCAVCKDGILVGEKVKRLPCCHHYHEECILPWLGIRNTCPLCRFELPTDDPEYEKWKARRAGSGDSGEDSQLRYEFEILPEA